MASQGNSSLTRTQRELLDKVLDKVPPKDWNKTETFEKLFVEAVAILEGKNNSNSVQPNLISRKRKVNTQVTENDNEMVESMDMGPASEKPFEIPKKTVKFKGNFDNEANCSVAGLIQENMFDQLSQTQDENELPQVGNINSHGVNNKRPPPIHTSGISLQDLIKVTTKENINKNNFHIKQQTGNKTIVFAHNLVDFEKIKAILVENKVEFYSFTPRHLRPKTVILKGIKGNISPEEIKKELEEKDKNKFKITKVIKVNYNKVDPNRYHYLVQTTHESLLKELINIKYIAYQRARWERPRRKAILQCKKCQRLGHVSFNCNFQHRCVKCAKTHDKGECEIKTQEEKENLKCANCGGSGHPASYKGCPFYTTTNYLIKKRQQTTINNKKKHLINVNNFVQHNKSYASMAAGQQVNSNLNLTNQQELKMRSAPNSQQQQINEGVQSHPVSESVNQPSEPLNLERLLMNLKNDIINSVATQIIEIKNQVFENTSKIDYILSQIGTQCL